MHQGRHQAAAQALQVLLRGGVRKRRRVGLDADADDAFFVEIVPFGRCQGNALSVLSGDRVWNKDRQKGGEPEK